MEITQSRELRLQGGVIRLPVSSCPQLDLFAVRLLPGS
jgi:hypothetical protein